jgi:hypothetical protein
MLDFCHKIFFLSVFIAFLIRVYLCCHLLSSLWSCDHAVDIALVKGAGWPMSNLLAHQAVVVTSLNRISHYPVTTSKHHVKPATLVIS